MKSTVPPGTTGRIAKVVAQERPELSCSAVSSPEFLREGHAVQDTLDPDRLVVGADDVHGAQVMNEIYAPLLDRGVMLFRTDPRTAELSKLASNAFLATKVSFANALARVAELADADVDGVTAIMGADPRIGPAFLGAGMGYGGYCLPKDVVTLEKVADRLGYDFGILRETARINEEAVDAVVRKVEEAVWNLEGKTIALLGLAFKQGTDDVRGAPALALAHRLLDEGATVTGFDPMAGEAAGRELPGVAGGPRRLRRSRRSPLPGGVHRVAGVPQPRPRAAEGGHGPARHRRRPQPARHVGLLDGRLPRMAHRTGRGGGMMLHGVHLVDLTTRGDERGSFTETFRQEWFPGAPPIVQSNLSISRAGVLRGLHVHRRQADYWCWLDGTAFVALYDLREGSPTHRQAWTRVFDANESLVGLYIPNGVAHGFTALTDARLQYMVDGYFTGEDEQGFAWNDPDAAITWPVTDPVLSDRDREAGSLAEMLAAGGFTLED